MTARILVAYASKKGSTAGIAEAVGKELRLAGYTVDVSEMKNIPALGEYDAVIIGAPVYTGKVLGDVSGFVARTRDGLARVPVAGFVTGIAPVYPKTGEISEFTGHLASALLPVRPVAMTMFAGKLDPAGLSFVERGLTSLLKVPVGDFRDWEAIAAWTRELPGKMGI